MKKQFIILIIFIALLTSLYPKDSYAGSNSCELNVAANLFMGKLAVQATKDLRLFSMQEQNFYTKGISTISYMIRKRLKEFEKNTLFWFGDWWDTKMAPSLKDITQQASTAIIDQDLIIGKMADGQTMNDEIIERQLRQAESQKRYQPSELACQADSMGPGQTRAYHVSKALNNSISIEDTKRRGNEKGSPSARGRVTETAHFWKEYIEYFCDKDNGDLGCAEDIDPTLKGQHKDITNLLWGDKQTLDLSNEDDERRVKATMRYLIYPETADPIVLSAVQSDSAITEVLTRRSEMARANVVYHVIGQIMSERTGGSKVNTQEIRTAANIDPEKTSSNASYRELQEIMNRDRFLDPDYILNMSDSPENVMREQVTIGASRLQLMNDIFRRQEELLLLTATDYSHSLDAQRPEGSVAGSSTQ